MGKEAEHLTRNRKPSNLFLVLLSALVVLLIILPQVLLSIPSNKDQMLAVFGAAVVLLPSFLWQAIWIRVDRNIPISDRSRCIGLILPAIIVAALSLAAALFTIGSAIR